MRIIGIIPATIMLAALAACRGYGPTVQEGMDYYDYGDYQAALAKFKVSEGPAEEPGIAQPMSDKTLVRYYVYRGLSHYHLGERATAQKYLTQGNALYQKGEKIWLPPKIAGELAQALKDLAAAPK
jgi:hypothetical protein